jgi:hypothetical protein
MDAKCRTESVASILPEVLVVALFTTLYTLAIHYFIHLPHEQGFEWLVQSFLKSALLYSLFELSGINRWMSSR